MSGDRSDVAALFASGTSDDTGTPDRTAGIPAPPPPRPEAVISPPPAPQVSRTLTAATAPTVAPAAPKQTRKNPDEPLRTTVPLAPGIADQLSLAAENAGLWMAEFFDEALHRFEDDLRAKDGVPKHRRRRGVTPLAPASVRLSVSADKRVRQIAARHDVTKSDVMRALIDLVLETDPPDINL